MTGARRALLCCVLVLCSLAAPAATSAQAQSAPASFGVTGPESVSAGETVTLNVTLDTDTPAYAVSADLRIEGGRALSMEMGPFLGSDLLVLDRSASGGSASFGATRAGVDSGVSGAGTVAQVTVAVPDDATGPLSVSFTDTGVADPNATEVATTGAALEIPLAGPTDSGDSDDSTDSGDSTGGGIGTGDDDAGSDTASPVSDALGSEEGSTAVVAQVAEDVSLDTVARALRANGARSTYTLPGSHAVGARIDAGAAGTPAGIEGVTALRTANEAAPSGTAQVSAEAIGAGRARASVDVPVSVPRVAVSLPTFEGAVAPEKVVFDAAGANGTLTVAASGVPADAPAFEHESLGGFTVSHPGIEASNVTVRFAVEGGPGNVSLYRLAGSWTALPTEQTGGTYRATAPGLSAFLAGTNGTSGTNAPATMSTSTAEETTTTAAGPETAPTTTASGGTPGFTLVGALLALVISAFVAAERRKE